LIYPKIISKEKLESFFFKIGLKELVKLSKLKRKGDERTSEIPHPPHLLDLYMLYMFITLNKRTTILEFGCGWSSLIMHLALKDNEKKYKSKVFQRCKNPFEIFIINAQKKYVNIAKNNIKKFSTNNNGINWKITDVQMTNFNGRFATEYKSLPLVNPDFIYLDAPNQFEVKKSINNFTIKHHDMMPMSCDILKFEHFLTPGTIIVLDGRTANARFLKANFQRNWTYKRNVESDHNIFYLNESALGSHNQEQINFYKKK